VAKRPEDDSAESRRIIGRVGAETEARMQPRGERTRQEPMDRTEYWGIRIGRLMSIVLLAVLLYWLYRAIVQAG